jgi:hypothetical protein
VLLPLLTIVLVALSIGLVVIFLGDHLGWGRRDKHSTLKTPEEWQRESERLKRYHEDRKRRWLKP